MRERSMSDNALYASANAVSGILCLSRCSGQVKRVDWGMLVKNSWLAVVTGERTYEVFVDAKTVS